MPQLAQYDPLDVPASLSELKAARVQNLMAPVTCDDGNTFQFARDDKETMEGALLALSANPEATINWRLLDNTEVPVDHAALLSYYEECRIIQAARGVTIDSEYMGLKLTGATRRAVKNWITSYNN